MRTTAPPLLPIFRSRLQGELLAATLLEPDRNASLSDLAHLLGADVATIQREVSRLERAGILRTKRVGRSRLVEANTDSAVSRPLTELVLKSFGPAWVVAEEFGNLDGIEEIYIFGSWAARYLGEEGRAPQDVDLLIIGSPDRDQVYEAALRAERRIGRQVNPTIRSMRTWTVSRDGFIQQVRSSPRVPITRQGRIAAQAE